MAKRGVAGTRRDVRAWLDEPRVRAVSAIVLAVALVAALTIPVGSSDGDVVAVVTAAGILVAVAAGAWGGIPAGVIAAAAGWALDWTIVADRSPTLLLAAPAWLAAGALAGWLAARLRTAAHERDDELEATEERAREADAKYRALTQTLPLVTYVEALDGRPASVSQQIDALIGYTPGEWVDDPELFLRLVHGEDRDRVREERASSAAEHGEMRRSEYRLLSRDGRVVWVRDEAATVRDGRGRPLAVQGYLLDISDRKAAEGDRKRLRTAELAATADATDRQRKTDFVAKAAALLSSSLDYHETIPQIASMAVRELAEWCVVDRLKDDGTLTRIAAARAEGVAADSEVAPEAELLEVIKQRRAHIRNSRIVVPLVSHGGRTLGALTLVAGDRRGAFTADDVSWGAALAGLAALAIDRARLHDEVETRAEAARVLSYVGDGVFMLDRAGVVRLWNPMAEAITGLAAESVVGRSAGDAIPSWEGIAERVPMSPAHEPGVAEALPLETSDGERWISISGVEFFGGKVFAFRDITDAHRLDELQADFIATASHELRTPLAAVYGAAQTLRRHDFALDEAGRERFIALIVDESERLGRIVNQILLANQLDAGRLDLDAEAFEAPDLLERVADAARTHIPPHISLEVSVGEGVPPVAADKDRVRQILVNLVENAIKYSPDGGAIEIGAEAIEGTVLFRVADEGMGIPGDEQRRVFEKFYRLDPDMTRGIGGTGLGLYICRELVERMGGRIWVEANQPKGSAFFFELPSAAAPRATPRTREPSAAERSPG